MADTRNASYLSIGEVLGLLLEEFPDVTISKIRFLESQGLISPERTSSGYRKFYDHDVQLLRVILAEQRENYLPLRVIKDRLETGEIDPTGEHLRPDDDHHDGDGVHVTDRDGRPVHDDLTPAEPMPVPSSSIASHPASRHQSPAAATSESGPSIGSSAPHGDTGGEGTVEHAAATAGGVTTGDTATDAEPAPQLLPGVLLDRAELCGLVGMTDDELTQLESFGVIAPRDTTGVDTYGEDAVEIARPACEFLRAGVDARHLRNWRTAADREALLYEQLVAPRFRQRNPEARAQALDLLRHLDTLGAQLRSALTRHALRHHFES